MTQPIKNLDLLIRSMEPVLGTQYAFCQVSDSTYRTIPVEPIAIFRENEGVTVVCLVEEAKRAGLPIVWIGTLITLSVHSSLDAVGFLARIASQLASAGISVNAFSPVSHDHLFVRPEDADRAMSILRSMTAQA